MANPTDSPRGALRPFPGNPPSHPLGSAPPPAETVKQRDYQPVAILAIVGLGFAAVYTLAMAIAAGVALYRQRPLILDVWQVVFPLFGSGLALVAWIRVQRSEGTLGGRKLALATIAICAMVGLVYWSYYLASYFAMRQTADAKGREWIAELGKGNLNTAFWYTLDPLQRTPSRLPANPESDKAFRRELEVRWKEPAPTLSQFEKRNETQLLLDAGPELRIESSGVNSWDFKGDGYVISLTYVLSTPEGKFELDMTVEGKEATHQEYVGRQWVVDYMKVQVRPETVALNEKGQQALDLRMRARQFVEQDWLPKVAAGALMEAFAETRPLAERDAIGERMAAIHISMIFAATPCTPGSGALVPLRAATVDSPLLAPMIARAIVPGFRAFTEGGLVQYDPERFWVEKENVAQEQEKVAKEVKAFLTQPARELMQDIKINKGFMPATHHENGRFSVDHQFSMRLPAIRTIVDGLIVLECPEEEATRRGAPNWRVARLELLRAKSVSEPADSAPGMNRPGMPSMPGAPVPPGRGRP